MMVHLNLTRNSTLKQKLDALNCPFTEDLNEDSTSDLVLSIGEGRLEILQWLMLQYQPKLSVILDASDSILGWKADSKLQKILTAANALCLCGSDDIILIRGEGPLARQMAFINRLIDLVMTKTQDCLGSLNTSQYETYINTLASQEDFIKTFDETSIELFPKDIRAEVDQLKKENATQPDIKLLLAQSQVLTQELEKQTNALQQAQKEYSVQTIDQRSEAESMSHLLSSSIKELSQLASGLMHSFEFHIGMWCEKKAPELNNLGPTFKRVDAGLEKFVKMLEEVKRTRQVKGELESIMKEKSVPAHESGEASNSFELCLGILEEANHRLEAGFKSAYKPLLVL